MGVRMCVSPRVPGIGSRIPVALCRINGTDNGWMDKIPFHSFKNVGFEWLTLLILCVIVTTEVEIWIKYVSTKQKFHLF